MKLPQRGSPSHKSLARWALAAACVAGTAAVESKASAQESAYCRKVRARAGGDAALLVAPTLQAQGIRFPANAAIDTGATAGYQGYQARVAASWSPLDFYRGFRVLRVGDADCERGEAQISAQQLLLTGGDYGHLGALRKQNQFLDANKPMLLSIAAKNDERLQEHVISLLDANEVKTRVTELERKSIQVQAGISRLEARGADTYRGMLASLMSSVEATSMRYEREVSHVRSLDAWDVRLTGGIVPQEKPDYFGVVQIGFNFGAFSRNANETRYLDARGQELRKARYELLDQLRRFRDQVRITLAQTRSELALVDSKMASLVASRKALASSEAPSTPHTLAVLDLERIATEAEQVFLSTLIFELSTLEDKVHGK